ncbi:hypothetical protein QBC39DRAFT_380475 [Podospora conica]|nr:hypothetical protein QBC39DRAFT_380475 [Schizothecium conicum]
MAAAIFAVPTDQKVLASEMGRTWFVVTVVLFSVAIFFVAYFLGGILKFLRHLSIRQTLSRLMKTLAGLMKNLAGLMKTLAGLTKTRGVGLMKTLVGLMKTRGSRVGNSKV